VIRHTLRLSKDLGVTGNVGKHGDVSHVSADGVLHGTARALVTPDE
jgi:hypothetical protein